MRGGPFHSQNPEMAFFQVTHSQAPVYFSGIYWEEEIPDGTVDVHCYVRIDGRARFADDTDRAPHLFLHTSHEAADRALDTVTPTTTWQQLSGTSAAANADGVFRFCVDCTGTAGSIYVDDWSVQ